jgi:nanoRNase/pAp phosphatase (c-di-AMP/oligoRNAs hydrolase)
MGDIANIQSLNQSLTEAKNILIIIAKNPTIDSVASGLALYLAFKKQNKPVSIVCPNPMTVAFNRLIGVDKITDKIGNKNIIISFPYDQVEKVSYNTEDNKLNLVVEPKIGVGLSEADAVFSSNGVSADVIFIIGATQLQELDNFYKGQEKLFSEKLTVNIDNHMSNTSFGKLNLVSGQAASLSEITYKLIVDLGLSMDQDICTNIYSGINDGSNKFQSPLVSANTFQAASMCLQNGAKKDQMGTVEAKSPSTPPPFNFSTPAFPQTITQAENKESQPPPDWFQPKIYKAS